MLAIDWIAIAVVVICALIGVLLGFGKLLKIFTGGLIGVIISIVVTYFFFGVVSSWGFVQDLMGMLIGAMQNANNGFVNFLLNIGIEKIILAVAMFIIVQIVRIIIVSIIKGIAEIDNPVMKVINRVLGLVFMLAVMCMIVLLIFHVIALIGGGTAENFTNYVNGSVFKIDWIFANNPLRFIIERAVPKS